ncbi:MAG TPA: hypothetical protein VHL52_01540 [Acidimicrobiia bacterium]|nr:hypothetical protein [Acidimicrobiia bacterium]
MGSQRHLERRSRRKAAADCRKGKHRFGAPTLIGGGMSRQTCAVCGAVTIDISEAETPDEAVLSSGRQEDRDL